MNIEQSPSPALLVVIPLVTAIVLPLLGGWKQRLCYPITVVAIGGTLLVSVLFSGQVIAAPTGVVHYYMGGWQPPWGIELRVDRLSVLMQLLITGVSLGVVVFMKRSIAHEVKGSTTYFYTMTLLLVTGLLGIVSTGDMFNLYVFLEISSIAGYSLIAQGGKKAAFFTFRYLIVGTIGACFYLLGVGYLYSVTGTLNMDDLAARLPELYHSKAVMVGFSFIITGMAIKMALFPLHFWLPPAYALAPSAVSALIAPTMTKTAFYILVRVMFTVFETRFSIEVFPVATILSWMGAVAMIAGSVLAISQTELKRLLAYSSVAQVGYMVLGVGLANEMGLTGGLLHVVNHAVMKCALFLVTGAILYKTGIRHIRELHGLYIRMPITTVTFLVAAFSMIGIPPTAGFFSKVYLVMGALASKQWVFVGIILLSSLLNLAYFINIVKHMFFSSQEGAGRTMTGLRRDEAPLSMLVPMVVMTVAIIALGVFNGEIVSNLIGPVIPVDLGMGR